MDRNLLIQNIKLYAEMKGMKSTPACIAAGVGKTFLADIKRGQTPSVAKVADLAAYLGVTTSQLIGETSQEQPSALSIAWEQLNDDGRCRLVEYAEDLVASGRYIKTASDLGEEVG